MIKANSISGSTLVGYRKKVGVHGNCFTVKCEDGKTRKVLNIGKESLKATGVKFPIEGEPFNDWLFIATDKRIPHEAFRTRGCFCLGGDEVWDEAFPSGICRKT